MNWREAFGILLDRIADGTDPLRLLWWLWLLPVSLGIVALFLMILGR